LKSKNVEFLRYCGGHFENGDEKFLPVAIFKMAATIPHKFNIVRFQRPELIPDIEKFLPVSIFKMAATIPHVVEIGQC
jgi:hypothetical protein